MQSENRFFDDLARVINGAAGTLAGVGREFETGAREKAKAWMGNLDFVSREEFDAVKALAATAREEVELLKARIAKLEGKASAPSAAAPKANPRPAARKAPPPGAI
ncbi:MAG: accessory factor UbiK family protein [Sphingobium sp.]